jgi:hypothetical protein
MEEVIQKYFHHLGESDFIAPDQGKHRALGDLQLNPAKGAALSLAHAEIGGEVLQKSSWVEETWMERKVFDLGKGEIQKIPGHFHLAGRGRNYGFQSFPFPAFASGEQFTTFVPDKSYGLLQSPGNTREKLALHSLGLFRPGSRLVGLLEEKDSP